MAQYTGDRLRLREGGQQQLLEFRRQVRQRGCASMQGPWCVTHLSLCVAARATFVLQRSCNPERTCRAVLRAASGV